MSRRKPVRVEEHDGPWSVSVAENQPSNNYSLYIQSAFSFDATKLG